MNEDPAILKFFEYEHLPVHLQSISKEFYEVAHTMQGCMSDNAEKSAGLRKLLEAKDCFVRGAIK